MGASNAERLAVLRKVYQVGLDENFKLSFGYGYASVEFDEHVLAWQRDGKKSISWPDELACLRRLAKKFKTLEVHVDGTDMYYTINQNLDIVSSIHESEMGDGGG